MVTQTLIPQRSFPPVMLLFVVELPDINTLGLDFQYCRPSKV